MDLGDVVHPRMRIFDIEDSPGERPRDHQIEPSSDGNAGPVLGILYGIVTSLGIMRQRSASVVPFVQQFLAQGRVHDFHCDFSSAKHELRKGGESVSGAGSPAEPATVEERIGAVIGVRHVRDLAAAHFRNDLELGIRSRRTRTTPADAGAAAKEAFVIGKSSEFDRGFHRARMAELNTYRHPCVLDKLERLFATSILVVFEKLLANLVVRAEEIEASIADPRSPESHEVGEGAARIEEAPCEDNNGAIIRPILE